MVSSLRPSSSRAKRAWVAFVLLGIASLIVACSDGSNGSGPARGPGGFESDDPTGRVGRGTSGGGVSYGGSASAAGGSTASGAGGASAGAAGTGSAGDAARAIEEADVIKIEGGRLYALSRYGGLAIVDVSLRDRLAMLGRHKIDAVPFEMYLRSGVVIALYNGFGDYSYDAATKRWTYFLTSYVVVLDARDPENIVELGRFPVGGEISDSRIIGDVLYVAAYENGHCWNCPNTPRTNVMSLDVSTLDEIRKVDMLSFGEQNQYSWRRSLTATGKRLYIAGPTWGPNQPVGSTIQVIDISDPAGKLALGAAVEVSGQIDSRWQMDEHDGVLRVISQPFAWRIDSEPEIQTFRVASSQTLTPLGRTKMTLPRPERLQSVRFDGPRAYAITFERVDPLFTIDLSDAANPRQVGELEMPGWVYHMEPRGDRVLGLGFDQGNPEGSITVSLFDVADLAKPTMLARVNFGGDWGGLAEDQDRIHKAFNLLGDDGLILVPFSGWSRRSDADSCYFEHYLSGVQLVDWQRDSLALRGVAPSVGQARRSLLHDGRLLTLSDERVEIFDVSNRDEPIRKAALPIAKFMLRAAAVGDKVLRVGQNWWTQVAELDVTSQADASQPMGTPGLVLSEMDDADTCHQSGFVSGVYSHQSHAYLVHEAYSYDPNQGANARRVRIQTVDASDPASLAIVGNVELPVAASYYFYPGYGLVHSGSDVVNAGSTLVISDRSLNAELVAEHSAVQVVDLANPKAPSVRRVPLPGSLGFTGLLASGNVIATSHYELSPTNRDRVRFFVDRVDVADPANPRALPKVNVPGSLLAFDAKSSRAITSDYQRLAIPSSDQDQCASRRGSYDVTKGCTLPQQSLFLVSIADDVATVVDSIKLPFGETISATALGDDRLFVTIADGKRVDGFFEGEYSSFAEVQMPLLVLSGIRGGAFRAARLGLAAGENWGTVPLVASGSRAVLSTGFRGKLAVVDAENVEAPKVLREVSLVGWVEDLDVVGNTAIASLGYDGAQSISLSE